MHGSVRSWFSLLSARGKDRRRPFSLKSRVPRRATRPVAIASWVDGELSERLHRALDASSFTLVAPLLRRLTSGEIAGGTILEREALKAKRGGKREKRGPKEGQGPWFISTCNLPR